MDKEFNLEEAEEFIDNIYQHKFDNMEEILEDGTQVVHLGGLDDIKFTDFESASFTLLRGEQRLKHQVKKQKEVIDKVTNDLQQIIDNVEDRTIISLGQFIPKLEIIQDELNGSNDILKEEK